MGKFVFLYLIIILSFSVTDIFSDSFEGSKNKMDELFDLEQLSSLDSESISIHPYSEQHGITSKAGLKSSTNRRIGWYKTSQFKSINRETIIQSKVFSFSNVCLSKEKIISMCCVSLYKRILYLFAEKTHRMTRVPSFYERC